MKYYKLGNGRPLTKEHITKASIIHGVDTKKGTEYAITITGGITSYIDYWFDNDVIAKIEDDTEFQELLSSLKYPRCDNINKVYWKCRIEHNGKEITECFLYAQDLTSRINIDISSIPNDIKEFINKKVELYKTDKEGVYNIYVQTDGSNYTPRKTVYAKDKAEAELYAKVEAYTLYWKNPMKTMKKISEELSNDVTSDEVRQEFWNYADKLIRFGAEKVISND